MKKIIYATDFSFNSVAALKYAAQLAQMLGDDLIALHVYPPGGEKMNGEFLKQHQKDLKAFYEPHLKETYDPNLVSPAVITGSNVADEILKFAKDLNTRMIVMGSCGSSKIKDKLFGTSTAEMIGKSQFPVLAVPPDFKFRKPKKILFASTFEDQDIVYLKEVTGLAKILHAEIEILHITHRGETEAIDHLSTFKKKVKAEVPYLRISYKTLFSYEIVDTLKKAIEEEQPDIVLMPDRKNSNQFKRTVIRDRIKKMQSCSPSPLLSYPALL